MKKTKRIKSNPVAKAMVEDRRKWAPRIVENKKRKNALKPKYNNYGNDSVVSFLYKKRWCQNSTIQFSELLHHYRSCIASEKALFTRSA